MRPPIAETASRPAFPEVLEAVARLGQQPGAIVASPWRTVESMRRFPRWLVSPTVFRYKNFRAFFFSREETRRHVHVSCPDGEAKFWLEPIVALADHSGLPERTLRTMQKLVEKRKDEIAKAWKEHFYAKR